MHVDLEEVCKAFFAFFFFFLIFPFSLPDGSFDSHWKLIFSEPPLYTFLAYHLVLRLPECCYSINLPLVYPPSSLSSSWEDGKMRRRREGGGSVLLPDSQDTLLLSPLALLFQNSSDRFSGSPYYTEVPFVNISNWARPSAFVMYGSGRSALGLYTHLYLTLLVTLPTVPPHR